MTKIGTIIAMMLKSSERTKAQPNSERNRRMTFEALDLITQLWTGERVNHSGTHYQVEGARFAPTPVQTPRIPIWVGGIWPNKKPMRRAARWDGVMPLVEYTDDETELKDLRACVDYILSHRETDDPFDVVYSGVTPGDRSVSFC